MAKRTPPPKQPQFDPYRGDVNYDDASQKSPPSRGKPGSAAAARGGARKRRVSLLALLAILLALAAAALAIIEKPVTIAGKTIPPEPIKLPFPTEVKGLKIDGVLVGGAAAALGFITMLFAAGKRIGAKAPVLAFIGGIGAGVFAYMHSDKAPGTPARWVQDTIDQYMPGKKEAPKPAPKPKDSQGDVIASPTGGSDQNGNTAVAVPPPGDGTGAGNAAVKPPKPTPADEERIGAGTIFDTHKPVTPPRPPTDNGGTPALPTPPTPPVPAGPTAAELAERVTAAQAGLDAANKQLKDAKDNVLRRLIKDPAYVALEAEIKAADAEVQNHAPGSTERTQAAMKKYNAELRRRKQFEDAMTTDAAAAAAQAAVTTADGALKAAKAAAGR